ncbi:MAG: aminoacetone oxidase family FAD-binding enzyme [Candidatus Magasanikbacteria bacterium]|nr:aminoacetone oxidase family FAD-binding enzyme [Candidatus Magasanikbacteria bacterium]
MRVAIIGGGAAGMMAAATINEMNPRAEVFLLEKNDGLGKKVLISGGGRCNVTTGLEDMKELLKKYPRGNKFLISALYHFPSQAVRNWFEEHGVPLKCEDDLRVFPVSDNGKDIVGAFEKVFANGQTKVLYKHNVTSIACHSEQREESSSPNTERARSFVALRMTTGPGLARDDNEKASRFVVISKDQPPLAVDVVVLALGGQAYRRTGSTGDGYTLAESLGHHITTLAPSLHSFIVKEKWAKTLAGVSFVRATISADCPKPNSFTGAFLFTHSGISGPAVFALSSLTAFHDFGPAKPLKLFIDFLPDTKSDALLTDLKHHIHYNLKKSFKNILHYFIPASLAEIICGEVGIPLEKKGAEISTHELRMAAELVKHLPLNAVGRGAGDEFVTAGGVELAEVDPRTMESKLCPGLYFAGEILNIDGFTGGFNLQASWATGRVVGEDVAKNRAKND